MLVFIVLVHIFLCIYITYVYRTSRKLQNLPKGPKGLPLLGNNLQLVHNAPEQLSKWAHQYGKLYTIRIGNNLPALVVSDAALIKQIFGHMSATGKLHSEIFEVLFSGRSGLLQTEGRIWLEHRTFLVRVLKSFGLDKGHQIESLILSEIDDLCDHFDKEMETKGKTELSQILKTASGNTLWTIISGQCSKTNVAELIENLEKAGDRAASYGLAFFSWIKYIAPKLTGYAEFVSFSDQTHNFVERCMDDHKNMRQQGTPYHQDVIHEYLDHVESMKDKKSCFFGSNGYFETLNTIKTLLIAGITTVSSNLHWALFYLTAHPEAQEKMYGEIMEIIGPNRSPSLNDRPSMPYTEAVIVEALRMASSVPFGVIHRLLEDITVSGYNLPKDLILIPNLYHVHHDPAVWRDPEQFRPERFLENENLKEYLVAFQPGRRSCPGEFIARDTMFLFLTGVIQKYCFSPEYEMDGQEYMVPDVGYMRSPKNLNVVVIRRASEF